MRRDVIAIILRMEVTARYLVVELVLIRWIWGENLRALSLGMALL